MNRAFLFNEGQDEVYIRTEDNDFELVEFEGHPCWIYQEYGTTGWFKSVKYEYQNGDISLDWDECEEEEVPETIRMKLLLLRS